MAKFWVGGSGNWSDTAHWATSSGGAGSTGVPTSTDSVTFDANSNTGTGAFTVTVDATANCLSFATSSLDGTMTLAGSAALNVYGALTFPTTNFALTLTGRITLKGTGTINFGNTTLLGQVYFDGSAKTFTLGSAVNCGTNTMWLANGTLTTSASNYTITCGSFSFSPSGTATLTLNGSTLNCTSWYVSSTNTTLNAGTSTIKVTDNGSFTGGGKTYNTVQFNGTYHSITDANTFTNLTRTGTATMTDVLVLNANQTVTGVLTLTGNSTTNRLFVRSNVLGTARTLGIGSSRSVTNVDFQDIAGSAASISGTSLGNCGGCSNITFTGAVTRYASSQTGTVNYSSTTCWSTTNGGASGSSVPLPQDTVIFGSSAGGTTYNFDMPRIAGFTCSSFTKTISLPSSVEVYGGITLSGTFTHNSNPVYMCGRSSVTLNSGGKSFQALYINAPGGTVTLGTNALTCSGVFYLWAGTFNASTLAVTANNIDLYGGGTTTPRTLSMGSGLWTVTGTDGMGACWDGSSAGGLTFNKDTANILLSDTSTTLRTFNGGSLTYNKLTIGGTTGSSTLDILGSNTFSELASTKTVAHTVRFQSGTTTTVAAWTITGTTDNVVTLSGNGASATLTKTGGGTVTINYANISYITASPGSTWTANNSTDSGNNSGWTWTTAVTASGGLFFGSNF